MINHLGTYVFKDYWNWVVESLACGLTQDLLITFKSFLILEYNDIEELIGKRPHDLLLALTVVIKQDECDLQLLVVLQQVVHRIRPVRGESLLEGTPGVLVSVQGVGVLVFIFFKHNIRHF